MTAHGYIVGAGHDADRICAAFGFTRGHAVRALTFHIEAGEPATVNVERLLFRRDLHKLVRVFESFRLSPIDERHEGEPLGEYVTRLTDEARQRLHSLIDERSLKRPK